MNKTIIPVSVVAVCAAAFVGCEWGGVHSGESWNDAYSWANFSGTYKLVTAVQAESSSSSTDGTTTTSVSENTISATATFAVASGAQSATINGLKTPVVPKSVTIRCGNWVFTDDGAGSLVFQGSGDAFGGSISYATGTASLTFGEAHGKLNGTVSYGYTVKNTATATTTSNGRTTTVAAPITWLNLTQKGNLLTFQDNAGTVYSGKITGASCPKADDGGYVQAGHIRFTFEARANSGATLSGSISGDWSGATTANTGTISNRTIDASYSNGRTSVQFQAVCGSTTVYAREVTPAGGSTN
ncbi:MAG: hypothetical protein IKH04_09300 [Kiritimatiellae bacterium]|nr:hypothetical protein [Kiritimatiellia bacterium]